MASVNVTKRGTKWQYRFEGAPIEGKRKWYSKSGFRTKKEALEAGTKALSEYNNAGIHFEPASVSVSDYMDYWLDNEVRINMTIGTYQTYSSVVKNRIKPALGGYHLASLSPAVLTEFVNGLKIKGYAKQTIVVAMSVLASSLDYAVEPLKYIKDSPMRYVKAPKVEKKARERSVLESEDWEKIIARFPFGKSRFHIPLMIGYHCGVRISECLALTWDDINLENCTLNVHKQLVYKAGNKNMKGIWTLSHPKQGSSRTIRFGETLRDILIKEKERQEKNEIEYGDYYLIHGTVPEETYERVITAQKSASIPFARKRFVCIDNNGSMTHGQSFAYCTRVIRNELLIDFDYHSLRHTHATKLIEGGANIKAIQTRLGHKNIKTTLQTYAHTTSDMELEAVKIFENTVVHK